MTKTEKTHLVEQSPYPGIPSWVKASGIIVGILALLIAVMLLFGGGRHGPARHLSSNAGAAETATSSVTI